MKSRTAETVLDESYLETRAKLLEIAAILDRIDRAGDSTGESEMSDAAAMRHDQLTAAIRLLLSDSPRRAQEIQQLFSRAYDPNWRTEFELPPEHHASTASSESNPNDSHDCEPANTAATKD